MVEDGERGSFMDGESSGGWKRDLELEQPTSLRQEEGPYSSDLGGGVEVGRDGRELVGQEMGGVE